MVCLKIFKCKLWKNSRHDFDGFRRTQLRLGVPKSFIEELRQRYPLAIHPVIRTHPETGKQGIYVNEHLRNISTACILHKVKFCSIDYAMRLNVQNINVDSNGKRLIAFWDNRAVQHYAASDYFPFKGHWIA